MNAEDAASLLATAVTARGGMWAEFGAGEGTFTRALAELLGPDSRIYAIDRQYVADALTRWTESLESTVIALRADFSRPLELHDIGPAMLDGILLANALHFVRDAEVVLARLAGALKPGGAAVLIRYDRRAANRWVPYPIPISRLPALAHAAGLTPLEITATRPSAYGGQLYVARATRLNLDERET